MATERVFEFTGQRTQRIGAWGLGSALLLSLALLSVDGCVKRTVVYRYVSAPAAGADGGGTADATQDSGTAADAQNTLDLNETATADTVEPADTPAQDTGPAYVLPADAPSGTNLVVIATATKPAGGTLKLSVYPSALAAIGSFGGDANLQTFASQTVTQWPATVYAQAPSGTWTIIATYLPSGGGFGGMGTDCNGSQPVAATFGPDQPVHVAKIAVAEPASGAGPGGNFAFCPADAGNAKDLVTEAEFVEMQPTVNGTPHYLRSTVAGQQMWIADSQDGFVRFDFTPGSTLPLHGWTLPGGTGCTAILQNNQYFFCGTRTGQIFIATAGSDPMAKPAVDVWNSSQSLGFEGIAIQSGQLWVAAHASGLITLPTAPPLKPFKTQLPALVDAWDVAAYQSDFLVVADGAGGVKVLDVSKPSAPVQVAQIGVPSLAMYLKINQNMVYVATPLAVHAISLANPQQPQLWSSTTLPDPAHNLLVHQGLLFVAAGHHIYALDPPQQPGPMPVHAASNVKYFAMDLNTLGDDLLSAEFQAVRRLHVHPEVGGAGVLIAPTAVYTAAGAVGQPLKTTIKIRNVGTAPLTVAKISFAETTALSVDLPGGPWPLQPGQVQTLAIAAPKTQKGVTSHKLVLYTDNGKATAVTLGETVDLQPGDALPAMTYQDGDQQPVDVQNVLSGRPGLVLVAAQSCPAGFMAMAMAAADLGPWIKAGKMAVVVLNPWDLPSRPETKVMDFPFPVLYTGLTTKDSHAWSDMVDGFMAQPGNFGPPMPLVYVVKPDNTIAMAHWGYETEAVLEVLQPLLP